MFGERNEVPRGHLVVPVSPNVAFPEPKNWYSGGKELVLERNVAFSGRSLTCPASNRTCGEHENVFRERAVTPFVSRIVLLPPPRIGRGTQARVPGT